MIDIHSHILFGLDDGAPTWEESLAMVRLAKETGTTDIVATPHANSEYKFQPEVIEQKIAELSAAEPGINIHTGCDFHLSLINIQDALRNPSKYSINHLNYILVEFPDQTISPATDEIFRQLQSVGLTPIITHPERQHELQSKPERVLSWVGQGCLVQVTAQSLTGGFGERAKEVADKLMSREAVHFVASDGHNTMYRPPRLDEAFQYVSERYGEGIAESCFINNPAAVIEGQPLLVSKVHPAKSKKKWYQFWS